MTGAYRPPPNSPATKLASKGDTHVRTDAQIKFLYYPLAVVGGNNDVLGGKNWKINQQGLVYEAVKSKINVFCWFLLFYVLCFTLMYTYFTSAAPLVLRMYFTFYHQCHIDILELALEEKQHLPSYSFFFLVLNTKCFQTNVSAFLLQSAWLCHSLMYVFFISFYQW